jgi:hypothetical protein
MAASVRVNRVLSNARSTADVIEAVRDHGSKFDVVNMTTAIHRLGKLYRVQGKQKDDPSVDVRGGPEVKTLLAMIRGSLPRLEPRQVGNIVWGLAALDMGQDAEATTLVRDITDVVLERSLLSGFKSQEMANLAWGLATLQVRLPSFMEAMAQEGCVRGLADFSPQALANLAWAYATLGVFHRNLMVRGPSTVDGRIM